MRCENIGGLGIVFGLKLGLIALTQLSVCTFIYRTHWSL